MKSIHLIFVWLTFAWCGQFFARKKTLKGVCRKNENGETDCFKILRVWHGEKDIVRDE